MGSQPDLGQGQGAEPLSFFGINLTRVMKVPFQHRNLSLLILVLCAAGAFVYARIFARASYESMGTLIHRAPPEQRDIPAAKNLETHMEEMKNLQYYKQLNEKFGLAIPPEVFANIFTITKPVDSSVIQVRLRWDDSEDAPKLINYLMDLHRKETEAYRRKDLGDALKATTDALEDIDRKVTKAMKDRDDYLRGKAVSGNLKDKLADVNREITRLDDLIRTTQYDDAQAATKLKKCLEDIADLKKKQKEGRVNRDDDALDEDYTKSKREIELDLITLKQEFAEKQRFLKAKEDEYQVKKPLADRGVIIQTVIVELERAIKDGAEAVEATRMKIGIRTKEKNDLRPGSARLRRLLADRSALQLKETSTKHELGRFKQQWETLLKRRGDLEEVENEWLPKQREVDVLQKEHDLRRAKKGELELRLRNVGSELEISSAAEPSVIPAVDFKKKLALGFLVPVLLCFGMMVVRDMASTAWRAETLADKLHLPVLARSPPGGRPPGQVAELSLDECRALSLRIRQFLPEDGAVVLVSSLNNGPANDPLIKGVSRYLGMRNERVLILDARIAQAEALGLGSAIEQRADGKAVEVVPGEAAAISPALGPVGLVQALVFDGQNWPEFTYHTRMAGVDYIPSGGPYPVTDVLACESMDELLKAVRQQYTIILLVSPALSRNVDTEILAAFADGMIVVLDEPLSTFSAAALQLVDSLRDAKPELLLGSVLCV